jgi:predicted ATPase
MTFAEILTQVRELLQSKGRVSYRALKLQFNLDDDYLEGLKDELIEAEHAEALITLATEQRFPYELERGTITRGWALAEQGQGEEGIARIRQSLAAFRAGGSNLWQSHFLAMLAEAYGKVGQTAEGLAVVAEAVEWAQRTGGRYYEAELYRLKGQLTLQKLSAVGSQGRWAVPILQQKMKPRPVFSEPLRLPAGSKPSR